MPDSTAALAQLAVTVGANVTAGQTVIVNAKLGQESLARAIAAAAYDAGAHLVDVSYADPHVQLARLEHAPDDALGKVLPWVRQRPLELAEVQGALISLSGPAAPGLLDGVDPGRVGRDAVAIKEGIEVIADRAISWSILPGPSEPLGVARAPGPRRSRRPRAAVEGDRPHLPPGRGRSRRSLASALGSSSRRPQRGSARPSSTRCTTSDREPT